MNQLLLVLLELLALLGLWELVLVLGLLQVWLQRMLVLPIRQQ